MEKKQVSWYDVPWASRCQSSDCVGVDGLVRKRGQFMPYYVPRSQMPQIDEVDLPGLLGHAKKSGVAVEMLRGIDPHKFCPHQRIISDKVRVMKPEVMAKPILGSCDWGILDGNHRWSGHVVHQVPIDCYQVVLPFERAIGFLFTYPKTYVLEASTPERN